MKASALTAAAGLALAAPAQAHFQLLYTPEVMLEKPAEIDLKLVFGHPMENTYVMDMGMPEQFFVTLKGRKTDLMNSLEPMEWQGPENTGKAYEASYKVRRNGDYIFVVEPAPYMEKAEDIYIQQITKTIINKGAMPTGWSEPVGLPTEIVPLDKPYQAFAGGTFTGQLLSEGKPAAGVECEIEYINAEVDMDGNAFSKEHLGPVPASAIATITDENGIFTFGIPRPGTWGFACLGSGPEKEFKGKELSQDAILWIHATSME
jgi:cobalt/nickel transport protein